MSMSMASFSPLTRISTTYSSLSKPHHHPNHSNNHFTLTLRPKNLPLLSLSPLRASAGTSDSAETAVKPPPENISVGTNGSASAVPVAEEVKVSSAFVDPRWVAGTWDLMQFRKNGTTDWDAVIDAGNFSAFSLSSLYCRIEFHCSIWFFFKCFVVYFTIFMFTYSQIHFLL